jgi:hypothetical protein
MSDIDPPFKKDAKPTPENVRALADWLTRITAYHPLSADKPWTFYEQVDAFLGPWGDKGYPIAYGKKYCVLFYGNQTLNKNPAGAKWVQRTLILLQVELKNFILARFRAGTLAAVTADELQRAAFASHPKAYTQGGLTMVVLIAPTLVGTISSIPYAEFKPNSPTFGPTLAQVVDTAGIVIPEAVAALLGAAAGPAHNQTLRVASARDLVQFQQDSATAQRLAWVRMLVDQGRCDHLDVLGRMKEGLEATTFVDINADRNASMLVDRVNSRMMFVELRYKRESAHDRELRDVFQEFDEQACTWRP